MSIIRKEFPRVRSLKKKGYSYFEVDCRKVGYSGKKRLTFTSKREALAKASEIAAQLSSNGMEGLNNSSSLLTSRTLVALQHQLELHHKTLEDAAEFYLEHLNQPPTYTATIGTLAERWEKYVTKDQTKNNRQRTVATLVSFARNLAKTFNDVLITDLDRNRIEEFLNNLKAQDGEQVSQQTRRNYLGRLKQFFNWCVAEELLPSNPTTTIKVRVEPKVPEAFTIDQVRKLLGIVQRPKHRPLIGYVAIGLFAGLRPQETARISWSNIHRDNHVISIAPNQSKTKRARNPELNSTLEAWLDLLPINEPLIPKNLNRRITAYRNDIGFEWLPDGLRHTYATYWLGVHENRSKLALLMGNTESVIASHYVHPLAKKIAEPYWQLTPANCGML